MLAALGGVGVAGALLRRAGLFRRGAARSAAPATARAPQRTGDACVECGPPAPKLSRSASSTTSRRAKEMEGAPVSPELYAAQVVDPAKDPARSFALGDVCKGKTVVLHLMRRFG